MTKICLFAIIQTNKWGVNVAKYYLNAMLNDNVILTVASGKLNDIDKFMVDNDIQDIEKLYDFIKDDIKERLNGDCIEFIIQYKYNGEIKKKPVIFKKELLDFKNCKSKSSYIYDLLHKNKNFKNKFDSKYINRILIVKNESSILVSARDYLHNFSMDTFDRLYYSLISRKKEVDLSNQRFENSEELEYALNQRVFSYTMQRDMYFDVYFWNKQLPSVKIIVNNYKKEDEFDEEMLHDQNPDKYIVNGRTIDDTEEFDVHNYQNKYIVQKRKRLKKENPNQLSFLSD